MGNLPHANESEKNVLGSAMQDEKACNILLQSVTKPMFLKSKNKTIFRAIQSLYAGDKPVDQLTVINYLKENNQIEKAGGAYYITGLVDFVPSAASIKYHIKILKKKYQARKLIIELRNRAEQLINGENPVEVSSSLSNFIMELEDDTNSVPYHTYSEAVDEAVEHINRIYDNEDTTGIRTGYNDFDKLTGGYQAGLHIIAARPSMGKTAWSVCQMQNMAENNYKIGSITLETSKKWFVLRQLANSAKINSQKYNNGNITKQEFNRLMQKAQEVKDKYKIFIDDSFKGNSNIIAAKIKTMKKVKDIDICFIDYLQLMAGDKRSQNRNLEVGGITRKLAKLSKQLDIPVVLLCQLSRAAEGKMPNLAHLRDSGEIEQNADSVTFIYRPEQAGKVMVDGEDFTGKAKIRVAKWRNGKTGDFVLAWIPEYTRFENYADEYMEEPQF